MTEHVLFGDQKEAEYGCRAGQGRLGEELDRRYGESWMPGYPLWRKGSGFRMEFLKSPSDDSVVGRGTVWGAGRKKTLLSSSLVLLTKAQGSKLQLCRALGLRLPLPGWACCLPAELVAAFHHLPCLLPGLQQQLLGVGGARSAAGTLC